MYRVDFQAMRREAVRHGNERCGAEFQEKQRRMM